MNRCRLEVTLGKRPVRPVQAEEVGTAGDTGVAPNRRAPSPLLIDTCVPLIEMSFQACLPWCQGASPAPRQRWRAPERHA